MAASVHCSIVSAEKEIFSGQVEMVVASGTIGELGFYPGHTPLLTGVKPGPIRLKLEGGEEEIFFEFIKTIINWYFYLTYYVELEDYEMCVKIRDVISIEKNETDI